MARRRGPESKLTQEVQNALVAGIAAGVPHKHAAACARISPRTFRYWLARGKVQKKGIYAAFFAAIKKAESDGIASNVKQIKKAASGHYETVTKTTTFPDGTTKTETTKRKVFDWCAAAWLLERRHPDEFGKHLELLREMQKVLREHARKKDKD